MRSAMATFITLIVLLTFFSSTCFQLEALQAGFYSKTCPRAERIVREEVKRAFARNTGIAPGLVRMHFHDCFVRGCDASILIDSTTSNIAEKDSPVNNPSLRGFAVIDSAKTILEAECKGVVSCADILAFAARDSVEITGGPLYDDASGQRDGRVSLLSEVQTNLPAPTFNLDKLTQSFINKDLTKDEMVTLSGARTLGRSHCTTITILDDRLYNFHCTNRPDPRLNPTYVLQLKRQCPKGRNDSNLVVPMDPLSQISTDSSYYHNFLANRGLFTSDVALLTDSMTASAVKQNARNQLLWFNKFKATMIKMGQIGVITGTAGEIRANCRVIN